jgi:hypothetical protein
MKMDTKIIGIGIASLFVISCLSGCVDQPGVNSGVIIIPAVSAVDSDNPKYAMASYYTSEEVKIDASVPQYTLPLDLNMITNFDAVDSVLGINAPQEALLEKNGFVIASYYMDETNIVEPYNYLKNQDIPIFVTSDTLLHLYHIQFDEILKGIEEREFFDKILDLSKALFDKSKQDYDYFTDEDLKEASRRNVAFFGVALSLLQTATEDYDGSEDITEVSFTIPGYVDDEASEELSYIEAQDGYHDSPLFIYKEDYSQYKPRGHYTRSELLKRYFKAMMWYGRMSFLMKGGEPYGQESFFEFLISEEDAKIQTIQASMMATALPNLEVDDENLEELWTRIYTVTSFFVGASDDLTPYEYLDCIQEVYGSTFNATEFTDDDKILELKIKLVQLRSPEIYGGTGQIIIYTVSGVSATVEDLNAVLEKTKGMRLMGQRFIPDSYMFQQLVFPAVDEYRGTGSPFTFGTSALGGAGRYFPRGLDVMAVLGSNRALEILENEGDTEYDNYYEQLNSLQENFSSLNVTEWNRNLYFSWIYTLKALLNESNTLSPTFMQTTPWLDKQLHTSLASWAELRHDTILYAKQSYTPVEATSIPPPEKPVVGYVEPVPEFYTRILALTKMTRTGLTDLNVLTATEIYRLEELESIIQTLIDISKDELENKELTDDDYEFIKNFGENLDGTLADVSDKSKETTIIADVHTDTNSNQVLEEGVGYVDLIVVAYKVPDGRIIAGAGPVFSYYEFKHPMDNRLTDEQWKTMLEDGEGPERPDWTSSFISE